MVFHALGEIRGSVMTFCLSKPKEIVKKGKSNMNRFLFYSWLKKGHQTVRFICCVSSLVCTSNDITRHKKRGDVKRDISFR